MREAINPPAIMSDYSLTVVLTNPNASNSHLGGGYNFLPEGSYMPLETVPNAADNRAKLRETVGSHRALVITETGDGGLHNAVEDTRGLDVTFAPMGTGNKNDVACMLQGAPNIRNLPFILGRGALVAVRPLLVSYQTREGQTEEQRALYSFGAIVFGWGAHIANLREFRERQKSRGNVGRQLGEFGLVARALMKTSSQEVHFNGEPRTVAGVVVSGGDRMAGRDKQFPVEFTEDEFCVTSVRKNLAYTPLDLAGLLRNAPLNTYVAKKPDETVNLHFSQPTMAQIDGEHFPLGAGRVSIRLAPEDQAVRFISALHAWEAGLAMEESAQRLPSLASSLRFATTSLGNLFSLKR